MLWLWGELTVKFGAVGLLLTGICLGATGFAPGAAWAQSNSSQTLATSDRAAVGKVLKTSGSVHVEHSTAVVVEANLPTIAAVPTKAGDLVYRDDLIQTGADGTLSIVFVDGTTLNVSENAKMQVNEFVYDPKGHSNEALLSLSKGTFAFIAGAVAHSGNMKIDTPLATMGIRGTAPRVEIAEDGSVKFSTLVEQK